MIATLSLRTTRFDLAIIVTLDERASSLHEKPAILWGGFEPKV